jgi:hypothetical protein
MITPEIQQSSLRMAKSSRKQVSLTESFTVILSLLRNAAKLDIMAQSLR